MGVTQAWCCQVGGMDLVAHSRPQPVARPTLHPWRKAAPLPKSAFPWLKALPATGQLGAREKGYGVGGGSPQVEAGAQGTRWC